MQKRANLPLNPVRIALWTLRDKAAQCRLALHWAPYDSRYLST